MSTYPVRSTTTGIRDPSPLSMYNTVSSTITRVALWPKPSMLNEVISLPSRLAMHVLMLMHTHSFSGSSSLVTGFRYEYTIEPLIEGGK